MKRSIELWLILGLATQIPLQARECVCGAPCDLLLESEISTPKVHTACNTVVALGVHVLPTGTAEINAGGSVSFWSGFAVEAGGELTVEIDPLLSCDPERDADLDGVDECLDCDEADPNNWESCASCVDGDLDGAWSNCDAFVTLGGPDCADGDPDRRPGVTEICNAIDDNCNGLLDECLVCAP